MTKKKTKLNTLSNLLKSQGFIAPAGGDGKIYTSPKKQFDTFDFLELVQQWPQIIGPTMAKHTLPLKNTFQTLTILTDHPTFSQALSFMEEEIKKKIIAIHPGLQGQIKRIKFQFNPSFFRQKMELQKKIVKRPGPQKTDTPKLHPYSPEYRQLKKEAENLFAHIDDLELKEQFISIYMQKANR